MLGERSQQIVLERERGATVSAIAEAHGISHQRVSAIVRDATETVNKIELDLMITRRTGEVFAYLIPYGPDYSLAMAFSDWLIGRLRARGLELAVSTRRASNGLALLIEDVTDYTGGER